MKTKNLIIVYPREIWEKLGEDTQDDKIYAPEGDKRK